MKAILAVFRLDCHTIRQYCSCKQFAIVAAMLLFLALCFRSGFTVTGLVMVYGLFYAMYPFAIGEKNQLDVLYATLPVSRREIVLGRYLFALAAHLIAAAVAFLALTAVDFFVREEGSSLFFAVGTGDSLPGNLVVLGVCFCLYTLITAIQFPVFFRVGYLKARVFSLLAVAFVCAVAVGSFVLLADIPLMENFAARIRGYPGLILLGAVLLWGGIQAVSVHVSARWYEKRSF
jgi:ABC-type transport system involved in multi-copper enzyme maturation permease subunit